MATLKLDLLPDRVAICRLARDATSLDWAMSGAGFCSVTRAPGELSVVCAEDLVPAGVKHEAGWRIFQIEGPFDFGAVGILAAVTGPLASAGIPIFALSTFDTDYVLVKAEHSDGAARALRDNGHVVRG